MYTVVYFLFVYNFTDHCQLVETKLQLIIIKSYRIISYRIVSYHISYYIRYHITSYILSFS